MTQTIQVPATFLDSTVNLVEVASLTVKKALDEHQHITVQREAAAKEAEIVFKCMKAANLIADGQDDLAKELLQNPVEVLRLLKQSIDKLQDVTGELAKSMPSKAASLGTGIDPATVGIGAGSAAYDSLNDNVVGRPTYERKASDEPFMRMIGR